jgi:hypothetical protein
MLTVRLAISCARVAISPPGPLMGFSGRRFRQRPVDVHWYDIYNGQHTVSCEEFDGAPVRLPLKVLLPFQAIPRNKLKMGSVKRCPVTPGITKVLLERLREGEINLTELG